MIPKEIKYILHYDEGHDFVETNCKTKVANVAYTAAQARLKRYSYLENLGTGALYADTDSVEETPKMGNGNLGDYLGDLTNEIQENSIQTFVTGGPKNYGYQCKCPDKDDSLTHCKIRGITLNFKNLSNVNVNVLKAFATERPDASISVTNAHKISRDRDNASVKTTK